METMNATATEARQHFNRCVNWVEAGARVQIVRHDRVAAVLMSATDAAKLQRLESEHQARLEKEAAQYSPEERAKIDQRIWDPTIRALMGLPPLSPAALKALRG